MTTRAHQFDFLLAGLIDPDDLAPLAGGSVEFYEAGTTTSKNVWTEKEKTNPFTSITLENDGTKLIYGEGIYKLVVKDADGNTEYTWDNVKCEANNFSTTVVSTNTTATTDDDVIVVNTNSGNVTITLPPAADVAHPLIIKNIGSNNVIVDGNASETIDGSTTHTISGEDQAIMYVSNGTNWYKANDVATSIVGLTATASEINTACDGITATAAEINTACDGITATAAEINTICDGTGLGIADDNIVQMDDADAADDDFARFTANGLEGRSVAEMRTDLGGLSRIKTGTYTGDGSTSQAITGVGFQPKVLFILIGGTTSGNIGQLFAADTMTAAQYADSDFREYNAGGTINSLDSDGFTVDDGGADRAPNENGTTYHYIALG